VSTIGGVSKGSPLSSNRPKGRMERRSQILGNISCTLGYNISSTRADTTP